MPARRHRFGKCQHWGFGVECHRCKEADRLDASRAASELAGRTKQAAELKAEVERLRGPQQKKKRRGFMPAQSETDSDADVRGGLVVGQR